MDVLVVGREVQGMMKLNKTQNPPPPPQKKKKKNNPKTLTVLVEWVWKCKLLAPQKFQVSNKCLSNADVGAWRCWWWGERSRAWWNLTKHRTPPPPQKKQNKKKQQPKNPNCLGWMGVKMQVTSPPKFQVSNKCLSNADVGAWRCWWWGERSRAWWNLTKHRTPPPPPPKKKKKKKNNNPKTLTVLVEWVWKCKLLAPQNFRFQTNVSVMLMWGHGGVGGGERGPGHDET